VKYAITLFLVVAVVVTGALSLHSRNEWWQKYLSFIAGTWLGRLKLASQSWISPRRQSAGLDELPCEGRFEEEVHRG